MEIRAERLGKRFLHAVRGINDNAVSVVIVTRDDASSTDSAVIRIDSLANRRVAVHPIGRSIGNCFVNPRLAQVPNADIIAPWIVVRDIHAVRNIVAHVELRAPRHRRKLDPDEGFPIVNPGVFFAGEASTVFGEEGQVMAVCLGMGVVPGGHVRIKESRNAALGNAHQHGKVHERLATGIAVNLQLDLMVKIGQGQRAIPATGKRTRYGARRRLDHRRAALRHCPLLCRSRHALPPANGSDLSPWRHRAGPLLRNGHVVPNRL